MEWKLFATLAETADGNEVSVDASAVASDGEPTVGDALDALLAAEPELADQILTEGDSLADGEVREHLRLLVDGRDPFREGEGLEEPVDHDAELALFPPVSGG